MLGILALQGNVREHRLNLERHGVQSRCIRSPIELDGIDGLILPGGESSAMRKLIVSSGLKEPVQGLIREGLPIWGTCAGVILLAGGGIWQSVDIEVQRNAYGSQVYSRAAKGRSIITDRRLHGVHPCATDLLHPGRCRNPCRAQRRRRGCPLQQHPAYHLPP